MLTGNNFLLMIASRAGRSSSPLISRHGVIDHQLRRFQEGCSSPLVDSLAPTTPALRLEVEIRCVA